MLKRIVTGEIYRMGRVTDPEAQNHQLVPQNPPDTNNILEISLALTESGQGLSQPQSCTFPRA